MRRPWATYRLQLRPGFGFAEAAEVAPYLAALGVSHVYCSPYLQAVPGSTHGYDVVDHSRVSDELGGPAAHATFCQRLHEAGLGQVLDIVPNHMAAAPANRWWWDVLENGQASRYAAYLDVDWDPPEPKLRGRVLLPILADHYGRVLEAGEIALEVVDDWFVVRAHDTRLPVAPSSLDGVLSLAATQLGDDEVAIIAASLARRRNVDVLRRQLRRACHQRPPVAAAIAGVVDALNVDHDALDRFLDRQHYRLAHWRVAAEEVDYRRFFDIAELVGLRTEDERVFSAVHELVLRWLDEGALDGVRVDHVDGLRRPGAYLARLRRAAPSSWIVVEKVLDTGEQLPDAWPVDGTTGYHAAEVVTGVLVDPSGEKPLDDLWAELTGDERGFADVAHEARVEVLATVLAADLYRLTELLVRVCEGRRRYRDFSRAELRSTLRTVLASMTVYRTYVDEDGTATDADRERVKAAVTEAAGRHPDLDGELLDLLHAVLTGEVAGDAERELCLRFQQLSGPVMAKGVEDTALYRDARFVARNEVGATPARFSVDVAELHASLARLASRWPDTMTTLSTQDTKRSEDVRARLAVLAEVTDEWAALARSVVGATGPGRSSTLVDAATRYFLLQNVVGAWPLTRDRATTFARKAVREAKLHSSWSRPDVAYEEAVDEWITRLLGEPDLAGPIAAFVDRIDEASQVKGLAQKLLQLTMPGVPDIYQGCELWERTLVDPDNRRPVDYERRRALLAELDGGLSPEAILARREDGLAKLWVVRQALHARRRAGGRLGGYEPLPAPDGVVAFARGCGLATVVPRFPTRELAGDVEMAPGPWHNLLTGDGVEGGTVSLPALLGRFPVALLERR